MKVLILYSSCDGQTQAISSYIANELAVLATCDVQDLASVGQIDLGQYQQVLIGASIRYGHFNKVLAKFTSQHLEQLNAMPSAFFAVNLTARKPEKRTPETNAYVRKFLANSPWQPKLCGVFAGALRYPRYRWLDRIMIQLIMRMTGGETDTSKEVEYTDWQQVSAFAREFSQIQYKK
ncbi:flavodoxin domain protein [Yersinia ruckeri]|uniref:menaquinone-dependent protoporphyrinogen IX dehydrogenase n=1 Tax=Yersinia ruckeri TaxID=29486 RepID=UPI0005AC2D56|nr:menaquinone-dependent protoporphyrinogen IX dehydrogenase [Yersinia ruckeri]AJI95599.1 flavodoxin domain protein [Yersinia ruckeri]MCW6568967.1 menaquinone-dependent protoporphyrinogen IX dehydrogenase [Yersinia ruckeri]